MWPLVSKRIVPRILLLAFEKCATRYLAVAVIYYCRVSDAVINLSQVERGNVAQPGRCVNVLRNVATPTLTCVVIYTLVQVTPLRVG